MTLGMSRRGNDGINTVVPFGDEGYAKYRKATSEDRVF